MGIIIALCLFIHLGCENQGTKNKHEKMRGTAVARNWRVDLQLFTRAKNAETAGKGQRGLGALQQSIESFLGPFQLINWHSCPNCILRATPSDEGRRRAQHFMLEAILGFVLLLLLALAFLVLLLSDGCRRGRRRAEVSTVRLQPTMNLLARRQLRTHTNKTQNQIQNETEQTKVAQQTFEPTPNMQMRVVNRKMKRSPSTRRSRYISPPIVIIYNPRGTTNTVNRLPSPEK